MKKKFENWLHDNELGLHKSVRTNDGLVYHSEACVYDHGRLRGHFHRLAIVNRRGDPAEYLMDTFSGAEAGLNPDVAWCELNSSDKYATVVFEIGTSQSLPDLRRKAYKYCSSENDQQIPDHPGLEFVVLVKRYRTFHLYIEIWQKISNGQGPPYSDNLFIGDQRDPRDLGVQGSFEKMQFFANAHAEDGRRRRFEEVLDWQRALNNTCSIPRDEIVKQYDVNGEVIPRQNPLDGNITFDAGFMLGMCKWSDLG